MTLKVEQKTLKKLWHGMTQDGTRRHDKTRQDTRGHNKAREDTTRHEKARARGHGMFPVHTETCVFEVLLYVASCNECLRTSKVSNLPLGCNGF